MGRQYIWIINMKKFYEERAFGNTTAKATIWQTAQGWTASVRLSTEAYGALRESKPIFPPSNFYSSQQAASDAIWQMVDARFV